MFILVSIKGRVELTIRSLFKSNMFGQYRTKSRKVTGSIPAGLIEIIH